MATESVSQNQRGLIEAAVGQAAVLGATAAPVVAAAKVPALHEAIGAAVVTLDVEQMERSVGFYGGLFGFVEIARERSGRKLECRLLQSPKVGPVILRLRQTLGKRISATQPGAVCRISLPWPTLAEDATTTLAGLPQLADSAVVDGRTVSMLVRDPDGYAIELFARLREML